MDKIDQLLANAGLSKQRLDAVRKMRDHSTAMKSRIADCAGSFGHLRIIGIDESGARVLVDDYNTITTKGFEIMARVWCGQFGGSSYTTNYQPSLIAIGEGAHVTDIPTRTALDQQVHISGGSLNAVTTALTGASNNGCKFEWLLGTTQGNGSIYTEAGLFPKSVEGSATGAGGMIAYKTYTALEKTGTLSLLYSWEFTFVAA